MALCYVHAYCASKCHPCAGAMLIFSVSFQFQYMYCRSKYIHQTKSTDYIDLKVRKGNSDGGCGRNHGQESIDRVCPGGRLLHDIFELVAIVFVTAVTLLEFCGDQKFSHCTIMKGKGRTRFEERYILPAVHDRGQTEYQKIYQRTLYTTRFLHDCT